MKSIQQLERLILSAHRSAQSLIRSRNHLVKSKAATHAAKDLKKLDLNILKIDTLISNSLEDLVDETDPFVQSWLNKKLDLTLGNLIKLKAHAIREVKDVRVSGELLGVSLNTQGLLTRPEVVLKIGSPEFSYDFKGSTYKGAWLEGSRYCTPFNEIHLINRSLVEVVEIPLYLRTSDMNNKNLSYNFNVY